MCGRSEAGRAGYTPPPQIRGAQRDGFRRGVDPRPRWRIGRRGIGERRQDVDPEEVPVALLLFGTFGLSELVIIAVILLLLFGTRLPNIMRSLGKSVSSFKKGLQEGREDDDKLPPGSNS
jgi:sec-independent protein translocase protein TatA